MAELYHLGVPVPAVPGHVLLLDPVLPAAEVLAPLEDATPLASRREYVSFLGRWAGLPVLVTTVGIGAPPLAIAVEELSRAGAHTVVLLGTASFAAAGAAPWVVPFGAVRGEGTSAQYAPLAFPAVPAPALLARLTVATAGRGSSGLVETVDVLPTDASPPPSPPVAARDLRCAALFVVAAARGVASAAVLVGGRDAAGLPDLATAAYRSLEDRRERDED